MPKFVGRVGALVNPEVAVDVDQVEPGEIDRIAVEALATQRLEIEDGFTGPNAALYRLATGVPAEDLRALVRRLRSGSTAERLLAARLLNEGSLATNDVLAEARAALDMETDPSVLSWIVSSLGYSRSEAALPEIGTMASHPSGEVRFQVPDALSMCSGGVFDHVADDLLRLSHDDDDDVRWSAVFELAAWRVDTSDERVRDRLAEAATSDPAPAVRAAAADGLRGDQGPD